MSARGAQRANPTPVAANSDSETPSGFHDLSRLVRLLAPLLAKELASLLRGRDSVPGADVSRRRGKEMRQWRRERRADEHSARTESEEPDGESSWSKDQAAELLGILRRKKKPSRSSDR